MNYILNFLLVSFVGNHMGVYRASGFTDVREYRYWNAATRSLDMTGLVEDLKVSNRRIIIDVPSLIGSLG